MRVVLPRGDRGAWLMRRRLGRRRGRSIAPLPRGALVGRAWSVLDEPVYPELSRRAMTDIMEGISAMESMGDKEGEVV